MLYQVANTTISLEIPELIALEILQCHIPGIEVSKKITEVPNITIRFEENNSESLSLKENMFLFAGDWTPEIKTDIPHLMYSVLRQYWIEHGLYPVHSIVVNNSLLIGHSGTGKTTLALKALEKEMDVFSFDKTVVKFDGDRLHAVLGTKVISVREKYLPTAKKFLKESSFIKNGERCIFNYKTGISREIKSIFIFSLSESYLEIEPASIHQLYSYFMDSVKTDAFIGNFLFNGNTSSQSKGNLIVSLKNMNTPIKTLIGTPAEILTHIQTL